MEGGVGGGRDGKEGKVVSDVEIGFDLDPSISILDAVCFLSSRSSSQDVEGEFADDRVGRRRSGCVPGRRKESRRKGHHTPPSSVLLHS